MCVLLRSFASFEQQFDELNKPIGSRPGIYGLPKVNKLNFSLRLTISSIEIYCYKVAKFSVPRPRLFPLSLAITDTFPFVNEILNLPFNINNVVTVSFDIKYLFTNIPLDETINIIVISAFVTLPDLMASRYSNSLTYWL